MTKLSMSEEEMLKRKYARPYEKRIEELEQKLEQTEKDLADYQFNYPTIKELSKENEELKGSLELYESGGCRATNLFECGVVKELKEQLTKAKEIIKILSDIVSKSDSEDYFKRDMVKAVEQAEQFLREIDIDNAIQKANEGLDLDKIADEVEEDLKDSCPDTLCEDCTKDCPIEKIKEIKK